jgi:hypothetical protein
MRLSLNSLKVIELEFQYRANVAESLTLSTKIVYTLCELNYYRKMTALLTFTASSTENALIRRNFNGLCAPERKIVSRIRSNGNEIRLHRQKGLCSAPIHERRMGIYCTSMRPISDRSGKVCLSARASLPPLLHLDPPGREKEGKNWSILPYENHLS